MADGLTKAKDWIIIVTNMITALCAVIALFYVSIWKKAKENDETLRRQQRKENARLRKEQFQEEKRFHEKQFEDARRQAAEDANKIAGVFCQKYEEAANNFSNFKEDVGKLKRTVLVGEFSEFHVLSYMFHSDNEERIAEVNHLLEVVEKIMKLLFEFRIQLTSIQDKKCPEHIKEEFSKEIIEMGQTIFPLVSNARQKVVKEVLEYFGCVDSCQDPNSLATKEQLHAVNCILSFGPPQYGQTEALHVKIQQAIPYISHLKYEKGKMNFQLPPPASLDSCIESLEFGLVNGRIREEKKQEILNKAKALWPESSHPYLKVENLLHLIRLIKFKLAMDPPSPTDEETKERLVQFLACVKKVVNVTGINDEKVVAKICERDLDDILALLTGIPEIPGHLMYDTDTSNILRKLQKELREYINDKKTARTSNDD